LLNILPAEVAEELKEKGSAAARQFTDVTVLFTDFVNFTKAGEQFSPQELVNELDTCFRAFDEIITRHNVEKIKTIGDCYMAAAGLPVASQTHAEQVIRAAIDIVRFMQERKSRLGERTFEVRIGVHSGSNIVAGIVGSKKFAYDIWGDTVNTASRIEQHGEPNKINISQATWELVRDKFTFVSRGEVEAKSKGLIRMYFVDY
jgi:class 3 adenylate cyclase